MAGRQQLGALRGLHPFSDILDEAAAAKATVEDFGNEDDPPMQRPSPTKRHATRASRGKVNHNAIYSSKYHPMNLVTKPNSEQVRRRYKSVSFATPEDEDDDGESVS